MSKGEQTRELILRRAAPVFNQRGYYGTSLSDIMAATGLEKGGIYNHFSGKDQLALEAFDYAVELTRQQLREALRGRTHAMDRLKAMLEVFGDMATGRVLPGGCPILNTAVAADDALPALRERARAAMDEWLAFVRRTVERGIERGELRPQRDVDGLATLIVATLEGAVVLTRLYGDNGHMNRAVDFLAGHFDATLRP